MTIPASAEYWDEIHRTKGHNVSWWQDESQLWLDLIDATGLGAGSAAVDVGAGSSRLLHALSERGFAPLYANDLSATALADLKADLATTGVNVYAFAGDVTELELPEQVELWHDRAAFHFLTEPQQQSAYRAALLRNTYNGSFAIIATFSPAGPTMCSGLPIQQWSTTQLTEFFGPEFDVVMSDTRDHTTPTGAVQNFTTVVLRRN